MSKNILSLALLFATVATPLAQARAADLDPGYAEIPALQEAKVEFGSGWYIRGDLGATRLPSMTLNNPTAFDTAPTVSLKSGSQVGYTASLGAGYAFNNWFRTDAIFDFHKPVSVRTSGGFFPASNANFTGTCQAGFVAVTTDGTDSVEEPYYVDCHSQNEAKIQSYDAIVNGYVDLGHWSRVTPYVGAGIGLSFGHYSTSVTYYQNDGTHYDTYFALPGSGTVLHGYRDVRNSGDYYNFAFALMAGVAIDVADHTKLDIGYRYLNLGSVLDTTLSYQEVRAGLRYMIDN